MPRTRADIERDIVSKRRERMLYVSPEGVDQCHAQLDALLEEWERTWPSTPAPLPSAATAQHINASGASGRP